MKSTKSANPNRLPENVAKIIREVLLGRKQEALPTAPRKGRRKEKKLRGSQKDRRSFQTQEENSKEEPQAGSPAAEKRPNVPLLLNLPTARAQQERLDTESKSSRSEVCGSLTEREATLVLFPRSTWTLVALLSHHVNLQGRPGLSWAPCVVFSFLFRR